MMTEAEAKAKWCPFARVTSDTSDGIPLVGWNRMPGGSIHDTDAFRAGCEMREVNCVGSACMAWRWAQKPNPDWKPDHSGLMGWPAADRRYDAPLYIEDREHGYCGLAGRPS